MATTTNFGRRNDYAAGNYASSTEWNGLADDSEITRWGVLALAMSDANTTLTAAQDENVLLLLTGALTANRNLVVRTASGGRWWVHNGTTGGFSVLVKTSAGASVTVLNGDRALVYCDGTDVVNALSGATIPSPTITTGIYDSAGNELFLLTATASAVNEFTVANAATGASPVLSVTGGDTNVGLILRGKGTGNAEIQDGNSNEQLKFSTTASAVNEWTITNAATGSGAILAATGGDTNISPIVRGKGTGNLIVQDGNSNEQLKFVTTASAVNELTITNAVTTGRPKVSATGDDTNISLELIPKGTGGIAIGSGGTPIAKYLSATTTWDPGNLAADGDVTATTITVTGAAVGDLAVASLDSIGANSLLLHAHVQAADTVRIILMNKTGGAHDVASGTLRAGVWKH